MRVRVCGIVHLPVRASFAQGIFLPNEVRAVNGKSSCSGKLITELMQQWNATTGPYVIDSVNCQHGITLLSCSVTYQRHVFVLRRNSQSKLSPRLERVWAGPGKMAACPGCNRGPTRAKGGTPVTCPWKTWDFAALARWGRHGDGGRTGHVTCSGRSATSPCAPPGVLLSPRMTRGTEIQQQRRY